MPQLPHPQPPGPRADYLAEREAIELMDETMTWNAAIEAAAKACQAREAYARSQLPKTHYYTDRADEASSCAHAIRALKRPATE